LQAQKKPRADSAGLGCVLFEQS